MADAGTSGAVPCSAMLPGQCSSVAIRWRNDTSGSGGRICNQMQQRWPGQHNDAASGKTLSVLAVSHAMQDLMQTSVKNNHPAEI